jgi:hypothetical protein
MVAMAVASRAAERRVARQRTSGDKGLLVLATVVRGRSGVCCVFSKEVTAGTMGVFVQQKQAGSSSS